MHRNVALLMLSLPLALALAAGVAEGQLPERPAPRVPADRTVPPPLPGVTDPRIGAQPAVRPGTIQREPVMSPSRDLTYLPRGEAPANVAVTAIGPRSLTLSWSAPTGASGYWIHQADAGQTNYYRGGSLVTETKATVNRLLPATAYSFKVSAVYPQDLQRSEGMSEAVSATTGAAPAPTGLTASVVGRGMVSLSWDGLTGADGFRLFRNGAVLSDIKPTTVTLGGPVTLRTTFGDSVRPGAYLYQIQAVYRVDGTGQGAEAVSALAPTPPVGVTFRTFRFCQTRLGAAGCAEPGAASVTIAASTAPRAAGRKSP